MNLGEIGHARLAGYARKIDARHGDSADLIEIRNFSRYCEAHWISSMVAGKRIGISFGSWRGRFAANLYIENSMNRSTD
jgi:hypothetical protein